MKGHDEIFMTLLSRKRLENASLFSDGTAWVRVDNLLVTSLCDFAACWRGYRVAETVILDALEEAIGTRDSAVSGRVLLRLVALQESLSAQQKSLQDIDFDGFFVKLLAACDRATRLGLAQHWCGQIDPPKQALIVLALDPDPALATYVIHKAKSLTENDLLHIAQRGTAVQWHALADRTDLSALVVDFLMVFADSDTRTRLKSNPSAPWSEPAANLFNRENKVPIPTVKTVCLRTNPPETAKQSPEQSLSGGPLSLFPRRDALLLATRLALHSLERPGPMKPMLPALLTHDLAQGHHARLLARLALATHLPAEAVLRCYSSGEARYFATLLWALDLPKGVFERLMALKQHNFPLQAADQLPHLLDHPLTPQQARQALVFFNHGNPKGAQAPAALR